MADAVLGGRGRLVIGLLLGATFVTVLNETVISVALPVLIRDLRVNASTGQWLSTAFALTMAVVIPVTGFLIRRVPTRRLFTVALGTFSAGTLLAALAPDFGFLLAARIIQGSGSAVMLPLLMTTVTTLAPAQSRGRLMGNISVVISVAPALGPTISGLVLSTLSWRWIFWLVLPIALVALVLGARLMPQVGKSEALRVDVISIPLAALGIGGVVFSLNAVGEAASAGTANPVTVVVAAVIGAGALVAFILRQRTLQRTDSALLDLRAFRSRIFSAAVLVGGIAFSALLGSAVLLPLFLQTVLRATPLTTGLVVLPGGVLTGALGPVVGRLYDRTGPRVLLLPGCVGAACALALLATADPSTPLWRIVAAHVLLSASLAFVMTPLYTAGLGAVPKAYSSYGSAIFATVQQVGGAAGTAAAVTLLAVRSAAERADGSGAAAATASGIDLGFAALAGSLVVACAVSTLVGGTAGAGALVQRLVCRHPLLVGRVAAAVDGGGASAGSGRPTPGTGTG